jgi:hypothetical protein
MNAISNLVIKGGQHSKDQIPVEIYTVVMNNLPGNKFTRYKHLLVGRSEDPQVGLFSRLSTSFLGLFV